MSLLWCSAAFASDGLPRKYADYPDFYKTLPKSLQKPVQNLINLERYGNESEFKPRHVNMVKRCIKKESPYIKLMDVAVATSTVDGQLIKTFYFAYECVSEKQGKYVYDVQLILKQIDEAKK